MSYKEEIQINKFELADLWETHQDRFLEWAEKYADSVEERDVVKNQMDLAKADAKDFMEYTRAGLELEILTKYKEYGFVKSPSDKLREVWVIHNDKYQDALKEYRNVTEEFNNKLASAEHKLNVLKSVKESFEHRKVAMDNLTRLFVGSFYSAKLPKDLKEEIVGEREKKLEERSREQTNETAMRRRRGKNTE